MIKIEIDSKDLEMKTLYQVKPGETFYFLDDPLQRIYLKTDTQQCVKVVGGLLSTHENERSTVVMLDATMAIRVREREKK